MRISRNRLFGFTLAELLIALLILGEIATFTIPKILSAQQNGSKKAVIKETIATLNQILYLGVIQGEISDTNPDSYVLSKINAVKLCLNNVVADGCATQPLPHPAFSAYKGAVLHNGALITVSNNGYMVGFEEVLIDWNGSAGPNTIDNDQLVALIIFNNPTYGKPGQVKNHTDWTSDAIWAGYFQ